MGKTKKSLFSPLFWCKMQEKLLDTGSKLIDDNDRNSNEKLRKFFRKNRDENVTEDEIFAPGGVSLHSERGENREKTENSQLRRLFTEYDRFSPFLARFFSKRFAVPVEAELESVEKTTFGILAADESHAPFFVRGVTQGKKLPFFWKIAPQLLDQLLDRMTGATENPPPSRPESSPLSAMSETDRRLTLLAFRYLSELLGGFWREESPPEPTHLLPKISGSEFNNRDVIFIIKINIKFCGDSFSLDLLLPENIPQISEILLESEPKEKNVGLPKSAERPNFPPKIRILAGRIGLTLPEIKALAPGDLVRTTLSASNPFLLLLENLPMRRVRPGAVGGNFAIEILPDPKSAR